MPIKKKMNTYRWIESFLQHRTAKVKLDGNLSQTVKIREGVPQGGVISPTLFVVFINDITNKKSPDTPLEHFTQMNLQYGMLQMPFLLLQTECKKPSISPANRQQTGVSPSTAARLWPPVSPSQTQ